MANIALEAVPSKEYSNLKFEDSSSPSQPEPVPETEYKNLNFNSQSNKIDSNGRIDISKDVGNFKGGLQEGLGVLTNGALKTATSKGFEDRMTNIVPVPTKDTPIPTMLAENVGRAALGTVGAGLDMVTSPMTLLGGLAKPASEAMEGLQGNVSQADFNKTIDAHADTYQKILNPGKNVLNSTNVDVPNASKTLAKQGVIIKTDVNNKLDNSSGIQQLQDANKPLFDEAQNIIKSNPDQKFDLDQVAVDAKKNASQYFKNAEERINAKNQIDNLIHAEIQENSGSSIVDAPKLYTIKQGMYERAFKPLEPTANDGARAIGSTIKTKIEDAFPESPIKEINQKIGDNLEAQTFLEKTNGNVVQGGKLGQGVGRIVGGTVGTAVGGGLGSAFGPVGIAGGAGVGGAVGQEAGANVVNFMNNPERLTTAMANKLKGLKITNPDIPNTTRPGIVNPEIVQNQSKVIPEQNIVNGLPNPQQNLGLPNKSWMDMRDPRTMQNPQGRTQSSNPIPLRGATQRATTDLSTQPKTAQANGSIQPNLRSQTNMARGGGLDDISQALQQKVYGSKSMQEFVESQKPESSMQRKYLQDFYRNNKLGFKKGK